MNHAPFVKTIPAPVKAITSFMSRRPAIETMMSKIRTPAMGVFRYTVSKIRIVNRFTSGVKRAIDFLSCFW